MPEVTQAHRPAAPRRARDASPQSTKTTPSAATTDAPVGKSQMALAAIPAALPSVPNPHPASSRPRVPPKKSIAHAAGTMRKLKTRSTPAIFTELVTTTPKLA